MKINVNVGLYALSKLCGTINMSSLGLYRDDGLATLRKASGSEADKARKDLISIFKDLGLKIIVQTNLKVVDYLDVTFNLETATYQPYRKPNDNPVYISTNSNHPPIIKKRIPETIEKRLSSLSSSEDVFKKAAPMYNDALKTADISTTSASYAAAKRASQPRKPKKNRSRKIIWFNLPYSANVKTNVARTFLKLITKHFPPEGKLHKIFNNNTLKVSYSCMKNMNTIIKSHNDRLLKSSQRKDEMPTEKSCNCRIKTACPLRGNCLVESVVYKATIKHERVSKVYIGLAGNTFKQRFNNHKKSFRHERYANETELSKYVWSLKKRNTVYDLRYDIVKVSNTNKRKSGQCNLCLEEKLAISRHKDNAINKRSELVSKCRHGKK